MTDTKTRTFDHKFEPGAYGVCRRCGEEKHPAPGVPVKDDRKTEAAGTP